MAELTLRNGIQKEQPSRRCSVYSAVVTVGGVIGIVAVFCKAPYLVPIISTAAVAFGIVSILRLRKVSGAVAAGVFVLVVAVLALMYVLGSTGDAEQAALSPHESGENQSIWAPLAVVAGSMMLLFGALLALAKLD
jgi:hypothetical protein